MREREERERARGHATRMMMMKEKYRKFSGHDHNQSNGANVFPQHDLNVIGVFSIVSSGVSLSGEAGKQTQTEPRVPVCPRGWQRFEVDRKLLRRAQMSLELFPSMR